MIRRTTCSSVAPENSVLRRRSLTVGLAAIVCIGASGHGLPRGFAQDRPPQAIAPLDFVPSVLNPATQPKADLPKALASPVTQSIELKSRAMQGPLVSIDGRVYSADVLQCSICRQRLGFAPLPPNASALPGDSGSDASEAALPSVVPNMPDAIESAKPSLPSIDRPLEPQWNRDVTAAESRSNEGSANTKDSSLLPKPANIEPRETPIQKTDSDGRATERKSDAVEDQKIEKPLVQTEESTTSSVTVVRVDTGVSDEVMAELEELRKQNRSYQMQNAALESKLANVADQPADDVERQFEELETEMMVGQTELMEMQTTSMLRQVEIAQRNLEMAERSTELDAAMVDRVEQAGDKITRALEEMTKAVALQMRQMREANEQETDANRERTQDDLQELEKNIESRLQNLSEIQESGVEVLKKKLKTLERKLQGQNKALEQARKQLEKANADMSGKKRNSKKK
jgi:hypothetical protein